MPKQNWHGIDLIFVIIDEQLWLLPLAGDLINIFMYLSRWFVDHVVSASRRAIFRRTHNYGVLVLFDRTEWLNPSQGLRTYPLIILSAQIRISLAVKLPLRMLFDRLCELQQYWYQCRIGSTLSTHWRTLSRTRYYQPSISWAVSRLDPVWCNRSPRSDPMRSTLQPLIVEATTGSWKTHRSMIWSDWMPYLEEVADKNRTVDQDDVQWIVESGRNLERVWHSSNSSNTSIL